MTLVWFALTMPDIDAWGRKWSNDGNLYGVIKELSEKDAVKILSKKHYKYTWDSDGWSALIEVKKIDLKDRKKIERKIKGFMGCEWMVDSIIKHKKIVKINKKKIAIKEKIMNIDNLMMAIIIVSLTLPILIAFNIFKMFGINISTIIISTVIFILLQILCFISLLMGVLHFENNICLGAVD